MTREEKQKAINALRISAPVMAVTQEEFNDYIQTLNQIRDRLEQEPCEDEYIKVPKKALKYRTAGMVAYNYEWLKNHFDIERTVICGAQEPCDVFDEYGNYKYPSDVELTESNTATSMPCDSCEHSDEMDGSNCYECVKGIRDRYNPQPCEDAISKQAVLNKILKFSVTDGRSVSVSGLWTEVNDLPSVIPQEPRTEQFAEWVASEIFDDNWEYNKDAFDEIACRKLSKLGIVRANGDEWELVEPPESEKS